MSAPMVPKIEKPKYCKVCLKTLEDTDEKEVGVTMYYQPKFTCSNRCHNRYWLNSNPVERGWMPIIWELHNKLTNIEPEYRIVQIKEKFGGLRFYVSGIDLWEKDTDEPTYSEAQQHISAAEAKSERTCEWCGEEGKARTGGWIKTLCDECDEDKAAGKRPWD